ncbi:hypothetical protein AAIB41_02540 [Brucella sp. BE17]|uniref:hypothetical protein n=1 Tax=Brucella sp. BE17 TaxID=3142977 RepID=UPI0031BABCDF
MTRFYKQRPDLAFLLIPASGDRSFEEIAVVASTTPYEVGTILVKGEDNYAVLTSADLEPAEEGDEVKVSLAILGARTVFHADDEQTQAPALAVVRDATIKAFELVLPAGVTIDVLAPYLEKQGLILRS